MSLRLKTILGIATIEALLLVLLIMMTLDYLKTSNYEGLSKRASTTATLFATTTKDAVLSYDLASLEAFVVEVMKNPDLLYARVLDAEGNVFAQAGETDYLNKVFEADSDVAAVNDGVYDAFALIEESEEVYGRVELGIDTRSLSAVITEAKQKSATIALIEMGLVALFSFILGTYLTRQLKTLTCAAEAIADGQLEIDIPVKGRDEVADVSSAFNLMASNLKEASSARDRFEQEILELNRSLEQRVEKRTAQLQSKNRELETANHEIKEAQAKLLQSEKMASVGVLAAGVAHEINNPIGFIISNLSTLDDYTQKYRQLLKEYRKLHLLKDERLRGAQLARIEKLTESLDLPFIEEDIEQLLVDTQEGSVRVKEIVQGLKEFSHVDQGGEFKETDINDCITSTLKIVNNELKYHCEIEFTPQPLPNTYCMTGQINQVILNMLVNAGQAIEGKGKISIKARKVADNIEIAIRDTGCGIPQSELSKLFDPFFTTKDVGEGTGLGLAISYGIIVDDHQGDIRVESKEGQGTCFTLVLPILEQPPQASLAVETE